MIKQLELCSEGSQKTEEYTIAIHDQDKVYTVGMCLESTLSYGSVWSLCPSWVFW